MQVSKRVVKFAYKQIVRKKSSRSHEAAQRPQSTYDDLPIPTGDWQTHYNAQQRKYNTELFIGVGTLIGTIVGGKVIGMFEWFNNFPARPATCDNYK